MHLCYKTANITLVVSTATIADPNLDNAAPIDDEGGFGPLLSHDLYGFDTSYTPGVLSRWPSD